MRIKLKKITEEVQIDMTPMLDVIFILLIFFVVATSFERTKSITIKRPLANNAVEKPSKKITLFLTERDQIFIENKQIDLEQLQLILTQLLNQKKDPNSYYLLIQADKNSHHGALVNVMDLAKQAGIKQVAIAVEPEEKIHATTQ